MPEKILFVAPNSWVIRNWAATGLVDRCTEVLGFDPLFVSHFADHQIRTSSGRNVPNYTIEAGAGGRPDVPIGFPWILKVIYYLRLRLFALEVPLGSIQMMMLSRRRDAVHYLLQLLRRMAPRRSRRRAVLRKAVDSINPVHPGCADVFDKLKPRCVVVGSPGFLFLDQLMIIEARRRGVPVHCVVNSWDNMTSRGPMIRRPDSLMVWNRYMQQQAVAIHSYPVERTHVVGSLQFSRYRDALTKEEVTALFHKLRLPPGSRYMLFLTGQHVPEYEAEDVAQLRAQLDQTDFRDVPLVVRIHPQAGDRAFETVAGPKVILDIPPKFKAHGENGLAFGNAEIRAMAALLSHAEVVFASWGTTALLEAAIFDRPIIQLRWMDAFPRSRPDQASRVYDFQKYLHLVPFDASGCRLFCDSPEKFRNDLRTLLQNDSSFRMRRATAVEQLTTPPLEEAPRRVVNILAEELGRR